MDKGIMLFLFIRAKGSQRKLELSEGGNYEVY